jgi:hypothetical protein
MNTILDRLNLRPQERRFVVVVGAIFFAVINFWFVWPHFSDWGRVKNEMAKARKTLESYRRESEPKRVGEYQGRLKELEGEGSIVAADEQSFDMARAINKHAQACGVSITDNQEVRTSSGKTNEYFVEKSRSIAVNTGEKELVNFLISVGSSNSMIRARTMILRPDPTQTRLQGSIVLVASYQRNRAVKPALPAAKPASLAPAAAAPAAPVARKIEKAKKP